MYNPIKTEEYNIRARMWDRLLPNKMVGDTRKKAKIAYAASFRTTPENIHDDQERKEMQDLKNYIRGESPTYIIIDDPLDNKPVVERYSTYETYYLAPLTELVPKACANKKKRNDAMYCHHNDFETPVQTRTDETRKRDYLSERLQSAYEKAHEYLSLKFNITDDPCPTTAEELLERFKSGKYTLPEENRNKKYFWSGDLLAQFQWRSPDRKPDEKGYNAALELRSDAFEKAQDVIAIADPAEGLKALQDFEKAYS